MPNNHGAPEPSASSRKRLTERQACANVSAVRSSAAVSELGPALHSAVEGLPSPQRRALELRVVQQLSYDEVAGKLGCTENAARLRVSRALRTLTLTLGGAGGTAG